MKFIMKVSLLIGLLIVSKITRDKLLTDELSGFAGLTLFTEQQPDNKPESTQYPEEIQTRKTSLNYN